MPRGGRRIGAGRKPKNRTASVLQHPSSSVVPPSTNEPSPVEEFDAPNDLAADERAIWLKQAPHAFANRTLTRATALSFERYCKVVVLERNEAKSSGVGGANHRGLLKQINSLEQQFLLAPFGKAMPTNEKPTAADTDDQFFGGVGAGSR
jgi:hypothetical protein